MASGLEIPGVKFGVAIAGLAGGVVSLSYVKPLSKWQAFLAVFTGAVCSAYLTPLVVDYFHFSPTAEHGAAFLVGLTAMNIIPGIIKLSDRFKSNPEEFIKK
jgi:hypothetical protein